MKPYIESLDKFDGGTFKFFHRRLLDFPFDWHYHREYELTLTMNSHGRRFVGDSREAYAPFDLVLIGPNVPHSWHAHRTASDDPLHEAFVFWFTEETLSTLMSAFPTFDIYRPLLDAARHGILFDQATAECYHDLAQALVTAPEPQQFALLIEALNLLSGGMDGARTLSQAAFGDTSTTMTERTRLDRVIALLNDFESNLTVDQIAEQLNMSPRTLSRFFRKRTGKSLIDFQIEARLNFAVGHLMTSDDPIYIAAEKAGYQNLSHFNRQFRAKFGVTPKEMIGQR